MISISTQTASATGNIVIHEKRDSELKNYPARVSRSATLDGGAVITHSGFSHGDRTLSVKGDVSAADEAVITALVQSSTLLRISMKDGVFLGAISAMKIDNGSLDMTILIQEKISA